MASLIEEVESILRAMELWLAFGLERARNTPESMVKEWIEIWGRGRRSKLGQSQAHRACPYCSLESRGQETLTNIIVTGIATMRDVWLVWWLPSLAA